MAVEENSDKYNDELYPEEEISEGDWMRPQVNIQEIEVITGEEEEDIFWQHRAKLYRWDKEKKTWKERGLGEAKLLKHKDTGKIRFLLRQEKTLKIVANHYVYRHGSMCDLKPLISSDRIFVWTVVNYAEGDPKVEQLALKLGEIELAQEFKRKFEEAAEINSKLIKVSIKDKTSEKDDHADTTKKEEKSSETKEPESTDKPAESEKSESQDKSETVNNDK